MYFVKAANTGISAVIDPLGRVIKKSGLLEEEVIQYDVPLISSYTAHTGAGYYFVHICAAISAAITIAKRFTRQSRLHT